MSGYFIRILAIALLSADRLSAQERVPLVTLDQLEERLAAGGDTTFVVNLWATWCAPCVAEMPHFDQLQRAYRSKPLQVLFVSLDAEKNHGAVVKFVEKKGIKSEVLLLNERDEQYFIPKISMEWSGAIPATLFVNAEKGIRVFKEQEFNYQQLETNYLSILQQKNVP